MNSDGIMAWVGGGTFQVNCGFKSNTRHPTRSVYVLQCPTSARYIQLVLHAPKNLDVITWVIELLELHRCPAERFSCAAVKYINIISSVYCKSYSVHSLEHC